MDTDNKTVNIELLNCKENKNLLNTSINPDNKLIEAIYIDESKKNVNISIKTKKSYYGESFQLKSEKFKLVIDIFNSEEPENEEMALSYLDFYETTGYLDRAAELKKKGYSLPKESLSQSQILKEKDIVTETPKTDKPANQASLITDDFFSLNSPELIKKKLNYNWLKESWDIHAELKKMMQTDLQSAKKDLESYKNSDKVDIAFLEVLSQQHNLIAKFPILLNTLNEKCSQQINNAPKTRTKEVNQTIDMLKKAQLHIPAFQNQADELIKAYQNILNHR
jgi:flagellar hook-basal body complex protein FliE